MFTGRTKPIRIIGYPDNQFPDKWSSTVIRKIHFVVKKKLNINPLNPELNPICYLLAFLAYHFLHVSRIRVKLLTLRLLMSYIWSTYS